MIAKVAGGVIFIGLLGTGSVALAKPGLLGMMPNCTKLSEDHDYSSKENSEYNDKFGKTYKDQLVGVTGNEQGKNGNKEWWEWAYKRLQAEKVKEGAFAVEGNDGTKKVGSAYSPTSPEQSTSPKALNRVCEDAYKAVSTSVKTNGNGSGEFNEEHVWKYCSWLGKKPVSQP